MNYLKDFLTLLKDGRRKAQRDNDEISSSPVGMNTRVAA